MRRTERAHIGLSITPRHRTAFFLLHHDYQEHFYFDSDWRSVPSPRTEKLCWSNCAYPDYKKRTLKHKTSSKFLLGGIEVGLLPNPGPEPGARSKSEYRPYPGGGGPRSLVGAIGGS